MNLHRSVISIFVLALAACAADSTPVPDPAEPGADATSDPKEPGGAVKEPVAPTTGALASVCWIETGHVLTSTASGLLVRHRSGNVLVDAGNSTGFHDEVDVYPLDTRLWLSTFPGALAARTSLPAALRALGVEPKDVSMFVPSHPHIDHVGGLMDMPDVPVRMTREDMALVTKALSSVTFEVVPAHARRLAPLMQELVFAPVPYRGFAESADLLGDGTVKVVRLPGHTPGSVGVFVRVRPGLELFHVGDSVSTIAQLEAEAATPSYLARANFDPQQTRETQAVLHDLHVSSPELRIIPAHDRTAWKDALGEPGTCLVP